MSDSSLTIYVRKASRWSELEQDGLTIGVTFMASTGSPLSARITSLSNSLRGSENSSMSAETLDMLLALLSTRSGALRTVESSTQLSHSGCWCNSSGKRGTSNA